MLAYLEEHLPPQTPLPFSGLLAYETKCLSCANISRSPSPFQILDAPLSSLTGDPLPSLDDAFLSLLRHERLDGLNQYSCGACGQKSDALRGVVYQRMPNVR